MKPYELVILLHPDLEIDLDKPQKKIEQLIKQQKGKIVSSDVWGKRKLSYPIKKEDFAVYVYYDLELEPSAVEKVEAALNITDEVLRYLLTHPVPKVEEDDDSEESTDKKPAKKSEKGSSDKLDEKDKEK